MLADGKDEQVALVDGLDDFLGPHGGAADVDIVHPDVESLLMKIAHQLDHLLLVFPRITYENVRAQRALFAFLNPCGKCLHLRVISIFAAEKIVFQIVLYIPIFKYFVG